MNTLAQPNDEIRQLFHKHVPEVAAGSVELVSVAREPGKRVIVAVRSRDSAVHAVTACVGIHAVYPKSISRELKDEKVGIVLWDESPENFILNALAPYRPMTTQTPKVILNVATHLATIEVNRETLSHFSEEDGMCLRLASQLVGWDIHLICHEQN